VLRVNPDFRLAAVTGALIALLGGAPVLAQQVPGYAQSHYVLPPDSVRQGVVFAGTKVPLNRREVLHRVEAQVNVLLMDRRNQTMDTLDRLAVYGPTIRTVLEDEKVPADLIYFAAALSGMLPSATIKTGGVGLWAVAQSRDRKNGGSGCAITGDWDDRRDPVLSTRLAAAQLKGLLRKDSADDWSLAMSAYVDGADSIDRVVAKAPGFSYWDLVLPHLSEAIIPRAIALKIIDTHQDFYGLTVAPISYLTYDYLDRLRLAKDLPLHVVAKWCGTSSRLIWELNPGVDSASGVLPKAEKPFPQGVPLRVPKGTEQSVRRLLAREGYLAN
jgi:hypothetical protein